MIFLFIPQKVGSKWYIVIYTINAIPVRIYCWRCIKISFLIGKNIYWWQHCLYKWLYSNFQIPKKLFCKMEMRKMCAFFSASCDLLLSFIFSKVCMPGRIFLKTQYRGEKSADKITQVHSLERFLWLKMCFDMCTLGETFLFKQASYGCTQWRSYGIFIPGQMI